MYTGNRQAENMLGELGNNLHANFEILMVTSKPKKGPLGL